MNFSTLWIKGTARSPDFFQVAIYESRPSPRTSGGIRGFKDFLSDWSAMTRLLQGEMDKKSTFSRESKFPMRARVKRKA
jgi:hypothetical protein